MCVVWQVYWCGLWHAALRGKCCAGTRIAHVSAAETREKTYLHTPQRGACTHAVLAPYLRQPVYCGPWQLSTLRVVCSCLHPQDVIRLCTGYTDSRFVFFSKFFCVCSVLHATHWNNLFLNCWVLPILQDFFFFLGTSINLRSSTL